MLDDMVNTDCVKTIIRVASSIQRALMHCESVSFPGMAASDRVNFNALYNPTQCPHPRKVVAGTTTNFQ